MDGDGQNDLFFYSIGPNHWKGILLGEASLMAIAVRKRAIGRVEWPFPDPVPLGPVPLLADLFVGGGGANVHR
jgi:hypothetical protein